MQVLVIGALLLLETWLLIRTGRYVGAWPLAAWIFGTAIFGVQMIKRQGISTIREVQAAAARQELPTAVLLEGMIVLVGGLLLILPGLIGDFAGFTLLFAGLRKRLVGKLGAGIAKARPDLKQPVTLDGEFRRK